MAGRNPRHSTRSFLFAAPFEEAGSNAANDAFHAHVLGFERMADLTGLDGTMTIVIESGKHSYEFAYS